MQSLGGIWSVAIKYDVLRIITEVVGSIVYFEKGVESNSFLRLLSFCLIEMSFCIP